MRRRSLLIRGGGSSGDACFERRELDAGENIPFDEASLGLGSRRCLFARCRRQGAAGSRL